MKNSDIRKTKEIIKRIMKYIFHISPKYFYLNIIFTILIGLTSAMSIWSTKLLINGIVNINANNIFIQIIQSLNSYINSKHQLKIDYKMSMDILEKCGELYLLHQGQFGTTDKVPFLSS
mgnify:CR=1 FL=1